MKKPVTLLLATMLAGAFTAGSMTGCSKTDNAAHTDSTAAAAASDTAKQGVGIGKIAGLDTALHTVTLSHNDVPGIMEAMTMEYTLEKPEIAKGFAVGDSVKFTMKEPTTGTFLISKMDKLH
jgi:Cu/Ag efflux protein CusF